MTVDFYTVTDPNNKLEKTLTAASHKALTNVDIFRPSNIESPSIICDNFANIADKNYCYIGKFGRYYYITGVTFTSAQRCIVNLAVDVLMTYAASIKECTATATRSESAGINYITDNRYPVNNIRRTIDLISYPSTPFTRTPTSPYILTVIGGNAN